MYVSDTQPCACSPTQTRTETQQVGTESNETVAFAHYDIVSGTQFWHWRWRCWLRNKYPNAPKGIKSNEVERIEKKKSQAKSTQINVGIHCRRRRSPDAVCGVLFWHGNSDIRVM